MDPHTARCLQLSTSIRMPYHQYRQNRFAESMNRSRFPVNNSGSGMRPTPQRAASMPANPWHGPMTPGTPLYQQPFTPMATPLNPFSPQSYHASPAQASTPLDSARLDASYLSSIEHGQKIDPWDGVFKLETKAAKHDGLGMSFLDSDQDFGPITFSATTENFDDLVRLNETEQWASNSPLSPDRRSISSASSGDAVSDFADLSEMSALPLQSDFSHALEMPILEEDVTSTFGQSRRSRSVSRAPAPRASSNRRFRRSPYHVNHTRSNSVISTSSSMSMMPLSMPVTQCCSPVEEYRDDFLFTGFGNTDSSMIEGRGNNSHLDGIFSTEEPMIAPKPIYSCDSFFLSSAFDDSVFETPAPTVLPSSGLTNDHCHVRGGCDDHADFADEPDLFGALLEEQSVPPEEDMKPEDPDMEPSEQELRFEGDLYTPRFVRGHGNKREGYCGLCKPGRWLVLKNSAFWYDKSFTHGISAATGQPFDAPKETRRMSGNPDVWEGLCGTCDEWIALISNKKKGTTWFRHAYKCHTHQKAKDAPKKRRDTLQNKSAVKPKAIKQESNSECSSVEFKKDDVQTLGKGVQALQTISALI